MSTDPDADVTDGDVQASADPGPDVDPEAAADVDALASQLGAAIAELPEYEAFEDAKAAVESDEAVQEAIADFERRRSQYVLDQQTGRADETDIEALQDAQRELHSMPPMRRYLDAQEQLSDRLAELNDAISAELSVDFGGEAGGCCHD
jgi:cell fate (sporulation/competence/biofilm development) regulator YlbF (YheA/YmcA/DUF963 family)